MRFPAQCAKGCEPVRVDLFGVDGLPDGATGFAIVSAVAKAALAEEWSKFPEAMLQLRQRQVVQAEFLQPR